MPCQDKYSVQWAESLAPLPADSDAIKKNQGAALWERENASLQPGKRLRKQAVSISRHTARPSAKGNKNVGVCHVRLALPPRSQQA
jgi:hypothetical protein